MRLMEDRMKNRVQVIVKNKKTHKSKSLTFYDSTVEEIYKKVKDLKGE